MIKIAQIPAITKVPIFGCVNVLGNKLVATEYEEITLYRNQ
jgi:hypothetical protein